MLKRYLLAPGPTPVPPEVLLSMAMPIIHHRSPDFLPVLDSAKKGLQWLYQTKNDVLILCSTGTGGMVGAVNNFFNQGDKVLVINGGKFGERWTKICKNYGLDVDEIVLEWGYAVKPDIIEEKLKKNKDIKGVFVQASETSKMPRFYFDFKKERENLAKNQTNFTSPVTHIIGLNGSLKMLQAEGLENVFKRHERLAMTTRKSVQALGLELYAKESPSNAVTAIMTPPGIDGQAVYKNLREKYGITAAGGQDRARGKIFRIAHLGYVDKFDVITAIAGIEMVLKGMGHPVQLGTGVATAEELLMD